jgi:hypothetical protein
MRNSFLRHSLFSLTILLSSIAHAQDPQLSCSGIQEKWLLSIDDLIGAFEYKMNEKLSEYVRIADFNVGDSQFGVTGHGDLGYIDIPEFDKKKPKEYMKSAIHDVAISPSYIIEAKVFESSAEILSASMSAGQGCRSKQNDTDCKDGKPTVGQSNKDRIQFNIKVGGITVLADENAPPETEAPQAIDQPLTPAEMAARLPSEDKKGTGGELLNIRRGFNGNQPIARIPIYDIFYVTIDAGYVLHAGIIFTYGIKSEGIFNVGGSKGYAMDMKSFAPKPQPQGGVSNPALDPQDYENCAMNSTACSSQPSTPTWTKSENFWANTTGPVQNITQQYKKTQDYIRDLRAKEAYRDASITKALWSDNIDKINNDPNLSPEEKDLLMGEMNLSEIKRDMKKIDRLMSNVNYNSQVILSAYNAIEQTIQQISEDGIPEVKANAGVVFDGTASVWANASAEINLNSLVRAWVGLEGGLTAVEATMGLGASVSSRSQYLDITGKLDYEVLKGSISLIWGYNILGAISDSGDMTLFSFPGKTTTYDSMIARVDFDPPAGKTLFFWCSDLFEDPSALDTERCRDGDVGLRKLLPALAAHDEYKKYVLDEAAIFEQNPCIITADGQALATSNETSSQCNNILPSVGGSLNNTTTSAGTTPHPILKSFIQNPQLFLTYLRDNSNKPILNFSTITPTGKFSRTYIASQSVQINPNNGKLEPQTFLPASMGLSTDGIENRLYTITSNGFLYDKPSAEILNSSSAPTETIAKMDGEFATMIADATSPTFQNDTRFQINLNNIKNGSGGTYGNSTTIFVGHLPSLSNQTLVDMAESYRLGECSIATGSSKRHMRIRSQPYPSEGFPNGDTFENAKLDRLGCDLGTDNPTTGPGGQVEAWEACQLRAALVTQKCFPPQRVTELIEFASLQPEQVLAFFSGSNKRISGELGFDAAKTEDIPNGTQDILEVNRTNNFYRSGRPINFNYPSSAPASTSGSAVNIALSNDRSIIVNSTNGGILKDIVSPNGNCPGYQKFNNAAMSFYGTSWAPQPPITDQIVTDLNPGQDVIVNMPVYGASVPVLLINKNGCWNDGGSGLINLNSLVASDQWDSYLNYYPGAFYSGAPSENRPHTVVVLRTQGNTLNAMSQTYFPWGGITWKAYIRSAQIIKPYAIVGKNNTIYPLNPVDPYAIAETYNELPTFQNGGYVFGNTICDPSHSKNINNFPDGPGYGGSRKPQMLSGALHKVEMMKAIGACVTLGGCTYVPISQKRTNPPTCTVQAKMGSTPPQTFNAGNPGKNLDQCLSSNLDFSSAQNFCQAHRQTLSSLITSQGVTSIQLLARWEQLVDIGNDLEKLDQDPASGPHNLGQCVFEKNGASPAQLVGSVNTQDPTAPNGSTDCLLNVSVFGNGNNLTLNSQSIGFTRDPITADYCKARLGYQNAAKSAIFNDNQTLNTCSAITGSQLLRLRSMGMIPTTGIANFDLKAVVSAPGQSNHGQSVTVGKLYD